MANYINEAATLIAAFSPATANAFLNKPFHRVLLAEAFEAGFTKHSEYTRGVCEFVKAVAQYEVEDRAVAAEIEAYKATL